MDSRTESEVIREVGELKGEVADLRGAVDVLRSEAFMRDVHAGIDASFARLHNTLDKWAAERRIWMLVATACVLLTFVVDVVMDTAR